MSHGLDQMRCIDAEDLIYGVSRIGQRPQDIEDSINAQLFADSIDAFHHVVVIPRIKITKANLLEHVQTTFGTEEDIGPQGLQDIGRPAARRLGPIAMLGDADAPAAMTNDAVVEILKVLVRPPPVPTISKTSIVQGTCILYCRIVRAKAVISSSDAPFVVKAAKKPANWTSEIVPSIICSMTMELSRWLRSFPLVMVFSKLVSIILTSA